LMPFGTIAAPVIRADWFAFVEASCVIGPTQPAISIIFFMVKTSFTIVGLAAAIVLAAASPLISPEHTRSLYRGDMPFDSAKAARSTLACAAILAIMALYWQGEFSISPERFDTSLYYKLIFENLSMFALLLSGVLLCVPVVYFLVWPLLWRILQKRGVE
jgi:hypothetical protein